MSNSKLPTAEEVARESLLGNVGPTYEFLVELATFWRMCATGGWSLEVTREAVEEALCKRWEEIKANKAAEAAKARAMEEPQETESETGESPVIASQSGQE